jgi:uncharacterized membrane protein
MYGYPSYIHRDIPYISTVAGLMMLFLALLSFLYRLDFGAVGFWLIWSVVFFATTIMSHMILYHTYEV